MNSMVVNWAWEVSEEVYKKQCMLECYYDHELKHTVHV